MGPKAVAHWMVKLITKKVSFCETSHHTLASKLHCRDNASKMSRWQIGTKANISFYLVHLSGNHKGAWEVSWFSKNRVPFLPLNCHSTREWRCQGSYLVFPSYDHLGVLFIIYFSDGTISHNSIPQEQGTKFRI